MNLKNLALNLIKWKEKNLNKRVSLTKEKLSEVFASEFKVMTNERYYAANYENYLDFLKDFCANLESIRYDIQDFIEGEGTIAIPMVVRLKEVNKAERLFDTVLILKFDSKGLVVHWKEIYAERF